MEREVAAEAAKKFIEASADIKARYGEKFSIEWLTQDASNRYYGRLKFENDPKKTLVMMVLNEPEAFRSEEATGLDEAKLRELPFVTIARGMAKGGVRTPEILGIGERSSFLLCEDFGDELLYIKRQISPALSWYEQALTELIKLQALTPFPPCSLRQFTSELLDWEMEHFVEYAMVKRNKTLNEGGMSELRRFIKETVHALSTAHYVLVHRDYHSKNLLVLEDESRVGLIDFQDALMGPPTYDIASLLRDSYVRLTAEEEEHLLRFYEERSPIKLDRRLYALNSLQRNMKAVGRFFYISMVKGRDTHLPYVKPTLSRIFQTLRDLNELRVLSLLEGILQDDVR